MFLCQQLIVFSTRIPVARTSAMNRWCSAVVLLFACVVPAQAHFIWIVPEMGKANAAIVVFSDDLAPDRSVPISRIEKTRLVTRDAKGALVPLKRTEGKNFYRVELDGKGPFVVAGQCDYGVIQKGKAEPFKLVYHAKALFGYAPGEGMPPACCQPVNLSDLEIVPVVSRDNPKSGVQGVRVLWGGKPLADADVTVYVPGSDEAVEGKADKDGLFRQGIDPGKKPGVYAIRVLHIVKKAGEDDGKKYAEVRHYATLVFEASGPAAAPKSAAVENPEATKLLAEARACRAAWQKFQGFSADLTLLREGKIHKGRVEVAATGKVKVELPDEEMKAWVTRQLVSVVSHRMEGAAERETPCAFVDDCADHPLGRAIKVLNDELHSSYRIRDRQIIEVNRQMRDSRFTITVLENRLNAEKKFLPVSYVVNTWDMKSGALRSSTAFHQVWDRVGAFDLPQTITVVTASGGENVGNSLDARTIRLTNHELPR
jgi:hypothetical protein